MGKFFDSESISTSSTPVGLTREKIDNVGGAKAHSVLIEAKDVDHYLTFADGVTPDADEGFTLKAGRKILISEYSNLIQLQIVASSGTASVWVEYES